MLPHPLASSPRLAVTGRRSVALLLAFLAGLGLLAGAAGAPTDIAVRADTDHGRGPGADAGAGPSVRELVEFTRILQPVRLDDPTLATQRSPDGQSAFLVTRRGDVAADVNLFEILLLDR